MKKITALLAILMSGTVFLASCGNIVIDNNSDDDKESEAKDKETTFAEVTENALDNTGVVEETFTEPTVRPYPGSTTEVTEAPETEMPETEAPAVEDAVAFTRGTVSADGVFTNNWMELKFTPSDNLVMLSDEEIKTAMNVGSEVLDVEVDADSAVVVYCMMAADYMTGDSVSVAVEKLAIPSLTETQYIYAAKLQLANAGIPTDNMTEYSRTLCGKEYQLLDYSVSVKGMSYRVVQLIRKIDDRIVLITISDFSGSAEQILKCFSAY